MDAAPLFDFPPAKSTPPLTSRLLRGVAWTGFAIALVLVAGLGVAPVFFGNGYVTATIVVLVASAFVFALRRARVGPWRRIGLGYAGLVVVLGYLAYDDGAIRRPLTVEELAPAFPGAEKSFEVLMRYGKQHPLGRDFSFFGSQSTPVFYQSQGAWKPADPQWRTWLMANRASLETEWSQLQPVRNWWAELNTFDRIGDLTPTRLDAEIITFQPIRMTAQHACAIASLQAIDGQGDAAFDTLLPILQVSQKLEPSSRTLVRSMIARVTDKLALQTAVFVLDTTPVSPAARARLASALASGSGGAEAARRLVALEYAWSSSILLNYPISEIAAMDGESQRPWFAHALSPVRPFVFNSRHTINLYGDLAAELQDLAGQRQSEKLTPRLDQFLKNEGGKHFKNLLGGFMLAYAVPGYSKVIETYWAVEDMRTALHTRLIA